MSFILQAINAGYSAKNIIDFLAKTAPSIANAAKQATNAGYSDDDIINYLDQVFSNPKTRQRMTQAKLETTLQRKKLEKQQASKEELKKTAIGLATNLASFGLANLLSPQQPSQKIPGTPSTSPTGMPQIPSTGPQPGPTVGPQIPSTQAQQQQQQPIIPNIPGAPTPEEKPLSIESLRKQFEKGYGQKEEGKILSAAKKMIANPDQSSGMTKDQVKSIFTLNDEEADATLKIFHDATKGLYLKPETAILPKQQVAEQPISNISRKALGEFKGEETFPKIDVSRVKKGEQVITPDGNFGDIQGISGDGVLVNVEGKVKKLKLEDLKGTPEFIKEAKIIIDPTNVEEASKSAALSYVFHPPNKSRVSIVFGPGGAVYSYRRKDGKPISDDVLNRLKEGMTMPVTTGDTYMGAWDAKSADSRGTVATREIAALAQPEDEKDDPSKEYIFTKEEQAYIHPFLNKYHTILNTLSKTYSASKRKPRDKRKKI